MNFILHPWTTKLQPKSGLLPKETLAHKANSFLSDLKPVKKGGKDEHVGVAS